MKKLLLIACVLSFLPPSAAYGHAFAPSLLELQELEDSRVQVRFKQPKVRRSGSELRPRLPVSCEADGGVEVLSEGTGLVARWTVRCPKLVGETIAVEGIAESQADVLLRLRLADGRSFHRLLSADQDAFLIPEETGPWRVAWTYGAIGVEHILLGWDHLLFVLGLVLLVPADRRLLWTVTAFTTGHSVTLALAVLGWVSLPTAPIEVLIALSLFVLAVELTRTRTATRADQDLDRGRGPTSWLSRYPWRMAAGFGLLHGLGFAAALTEVGLPQGEIPAALLAFNVGIEAGQLAFIVALLVLAHGLRVTLGPWIQNMQSLDDGRLTRLGGMAGAYGIGCLSAFWVLERMFG